MVIKHKELVSVIIPVYNRTQELIRALSSVLVQSMQDFEVIVVDDGSDDDFKMVCDLFNDERIRFFRNEEHKNANAVRNRGLREAKGKYIAMLDSDDEFLPEHLQQRVEMIESCGCDGIFGSAYLFDGVSQRIKYSRPLGKNESMVNYLLTDGFCPTPSHFYNAEAARQIMWDESLSRHQDYDFSIRFAGKYDFRCDPEPTVRIHWHRNHKHRLSHTHFSSHKLFIEKYKDRISIPALINYYYSMRKKAKTRGSKNQYDYYRDEMKKTVKCYMIPMLLGWVKLKVLKNKVLYHYLNGKY